MEKGIASVFNSFGSFDILAHQIGIEEGYGSGGDGVVPS